MAWNGGSFFAFIMGRAQKQGGERMLPCARCFSSVADNKALMRPNASNANQRRSFDGGEQSKVITPKGTSREPIFGRDSHRA